MMTWLVLILGIWLAFIAACLLRDEIGDANNWQE